MLRVPAMAFFHLPPLLSLVEVINRTIQHGITQEYTSHVVTTNSYFLQGLQVKPAPKWVVLILLIILVFAGQVITFMRFIFVEYYVLY